MGLQISTTRQSGNFTRSTNRRITAIVIHWWNSPDKSPGFDGAVNFLCSPSSRVSAHYVVGGDRVARLVDEAHVAWHARRGNVQTIGIECDPRADDVTYRTIGALVADIRRRRGPLPLQRHSHWVATQCPGVYDLGRIDREAAAAAGGAPPRGSIVNVADVVVAASPHEAAAALLGADVITAWQRVSGTPVDGVLSTPSLLVAAVQETANRSTGARLVVDGLLGPATITAVQADLVRKGHSLVVDGLLGPATAAAIRKELSGWLVP